MQDGPRLRLTLLGGMTLRVDGVVNDELPQGVQRFVAFLSLSGRPARAAVAGQLWPDVTEEQAQHRLRTALWRVQKTAPGLIAPVNGALALGASVRTDVSEFTAWSRRVLDPAMPVRACLEADPNVSGDLLPGWYDDWVLLERERLRHLRLHVCEALCDKLVESGRFGEAVEVAHESIRLAPLRESAYRALIGALAAEGNLGEALRAYQQFSDRLADELGLAPSVRLESFVRQLADAQSVRTPSAVPERSWRGLMRT